MSQSRCSDGIDCNTSIIAPRNDSRSPIRNSRAVGNDSAASSAIIAKASMCPNLSPNWSIGICGGFGNNAGIFVAKPFTSYTHEDYVNVLAVNLNGFFYITQLALTEMLKQGAGHIVNITTSLVDHAIDGVPSVLASLTKGGLNAATKSLAIEYAKRGIRVNAVSPGIIKTPMHGEETHAALGSLHPVGHMGEASDIAQAIIYLENAGFVTGEILHVDGGQSAGH